MVYPTPHKTPSSTHKVAYTSSGCDVQYAYFICLKDAEAYIEYLASHRTISYDTTLLHDVNQTLEEYQQVVLYGVSVKELRKKYTRCKSKLKSIAKLTSCQRDIQEYRGSLGTSYGNNKVLGENLDMLSSHLGYTIDMIDTVLQNLKEIN
jgi:hypothetical protein